ncbi:MAG: phage tail sheath family protein [bacterium]|nr:phage tail sheath family protein [bacterium]
MPEYLAPGVYVEEFEIGAKPIEGVSTSTLGILGETERGPVAPKLITNFEEFRRSYGGYIPRSYLAYAIEGFFTNGGKRCYVARVTGAGSKYASLGILAAAGGAAETPPADLAGKGKDGETGKKNGKASASGAVFMLRALGPGMWGNHVALKIEDAGLASMNPSLFKLTVAYWKEMPPVPVVDPGDPTKEKEPNRREPVIYETFDNLSPDPSSSDNYEKKMNDVSVLVEIKKLGSGRPTNMGFQFLREGKNGSAITLGDYKGSSGPEPGNETGLLAFKEVDDISILCAPNENDIQGLTGALVAHSELMKDRFTIIQAGQSAGPIGKLLPPTDSKYAAFYYPWLNVVDPLTQNLKLVPPGGHMAGIYARSDIERGVHKAPANEVVRGVSSLQFALSKAKQDVLNPRGVNCIRVFTGRGIRIWGARTISSDPLWKYINVRRLFLYIEESIEKGTQWVVFEPNNEALWARVAQTISQFLTGVWKTGALMGTSAGEGFFVKCDRTTMTQDDIDNGRLVCVIGVAPTKPAEFVIFRIAQWTASA